MLNCDRSRLERLIEIWNVEHLEIFKLTYPDEKEIFSGIIRLFYFDINDEINSQCIKIDSNCTVEELICKFMEKNISRQKYSYCVLYTVFSSGEYILLDNNDKILYIQLSWVESGIQGRFLLKEVLPSYKKISYNISNNNNNPLKSKLKVNISELFEKLPSNSLNSGCINQEETLKRLRRQKLYNKIKEYMDYEKHYGNKYVHLEKEGMNKLGALKIFVNTILPEAPYKTVLVSIYDTARNVIKETLNKFTGTNVDVNENKYFLTMLIRNKINDSKNGNNKHIKKTQTEYMILDDDFPLLLYYKYSTNNTNVMFHLRRRICRPDENVKITDYARNIMLQQKYFAILCELTAKDIVDKPQDHPAVIAINKDIIAIGSNSYNLRDGKYLGQKATQFILIKHHSIHPLHCIISGLNGILSITPALLEADVRVDGNRIYETTTLLNGNEIAIGCAYFYKVFIQNKISAETSQIYWHTNNSSSSSQQKQSNNKITLSSNNNEPKLSICLPIEIRFEKRYFEPIISKLLDMIFNTKIVFKPVIGYTMYVIFISQYENCTKDCNKNEQHIESVITALNEFQGFCKICSKMVDESITYNDQSLEVLLMWLCNMSEFWNFIAHDIYLKDINDDLKIFIEHCIRITVNEINRKFEVEISKYLHTFYLPLNESNENTEELDIIIKFDPSTYNDQQSNNDDNSKINLFHFLHSFNKWLGLFCKYQINLSFTIQIFQRIFTFINKYLIDKLLLSNEEFYQSNLIEILTARLNIVILWAESQGLEVVFNKCLEPFSRLIHFLSLNITDCDTLEKAVIECDVINSQQFQIIFSKWNLFNHYTPLDSNWIEYITHYIQQYHDTVNEQIGNIKIEFQRSDIKPFFISPNGYTSDNPQQINDIIINIIQNVTQSIDNIQIFKSQANLHNWNCRFESYFHLPFDQTSTNQSPTKNTPINRNIFIIINKDPSSVLGMRILSIKNSITNTIGIYVSHINDDTIVKKDGRITVGDQLVSVNGVSLIGIDEIKAVSIIQNSGNVLKFEVLKNSAQLHGLENILGKKLLVKPPPRSISLKSNIYEEKTKSIYIGNSDTSKPPLRNSKSVYEENTHIPKWASCDSPTKNESNPSRDDEYKSLLLLSAARTNQLLPSNTSSQNFVPRFVKSKEEEIVSSVFQEEPCKLSEAFLKKEYC